MKEGWERKKLGEICCKKQQIVRAVKKYSPTDNIVYIDISAIDSSTNEIKEPTTMLLKDAPSRAQQVVEKNDILVSLVRPNLKNIALICDDKNNLVASSGFCVLRTKENPRFLKYIVLGEPFTNYLISRTSGANYPAVREDDVKGYSIPLPPLPEQEKIVAELDCLSGIIEKKKQQLKELDALAQSIFYEMFGDPEDSLFPLQRLSSLSTSKLSYGSGASAIDYNGEVRYIRITDIMEDGNLNTNAMSPSVYDEKYRLYEGDILFARSGATVGKTYLYKESDGVAIYAGYLIRFVPNHELVIPEYIYYFTRSSYYQAFIKKSAQAVAQPNINAKQYGDLQVSVPPLSLQHSFASKVEAIEKQKELIKQSIAETELLFNSRMQYYFG